MYGDRAGVFSGDTVRMGKFLRQVHSYETDTEDGSYCFRS